MARESQNGYDTRGQRRGQQSWWILAERRKRRQAAYRRRQRLADLEMMTAIGLRDRD